ncbi:MAG: hypothetical protein R3A51_14870 [Nannocystaceae bacterium]
MLSRIAIVGVLRVDGLRLVRDRFLLGMSAYLIGLSALMRWLLPWAAAELDARYGFQLTPYFALIVSHLVVVLAPFTVGVVGGFLLLESREDRTVRALLVTPVSLPSYLAVLTTVMIGAGALLTLAEAAIIGRALPPWGPLVAVAIAGAPAGAAWALYMAGVADDKVEAMVHLKIGATIALVPAGAYFLPGAWQWLGALHPSFWAMKGYWAAQAGEPWLGWIVAAAIAGAAWLLALSRLFLRAARR